MNHDVVWYREEIEILFQLVSAEIGRVGDAADENQRISLGHLWSKLRKALETAPSMIAS